MLIIFLYYNMNGVNHGMSVKKNIKLATGYLFGTKHKGVLWSDKFFFCLSIFLVLCNLSVGFNLDAKFPTFFKGPENTYFGYSIDYFSGSARKW